MSGWKWIVIVCLIVLGLEMIVFPVDRWLLTRLALPTMVIAAAVWLLHFRGAGLVGILTLSAAAAWMAFGLYEDQHYAAKFPAKDTVNGIRIASSPLSYCGALAFALEPSSLERLTGESPLEFLNGSTDGNRGWRETHFAPGILGISDLGLPGRSWSGLGCGFDHILAHDANTAARAPGSFYYVGENFIALVNPRQELAFFVFFD